MLLLVFAPLLLPSAADDHNLAVLKHRFRNFKAMFNLDFGEADAKREAIFHDNVRYIEEINAQNLSYRLAVNKFTHLTREEFRDMMGLGGILNPGPPRLRNSHKSGKSLFVYRGDPDDLPMKVDWREKGYVTPVKNQGSCGSCWAFSAAGALEALHKNMTGELVSLSEQELVDCSSSYGNNGCGGGLMDHAFEYVERMGLGSDESYGYEADNKLCRSDNARAIEAGSVGFPDYGPVSLAIDVESDIFQYYEGGIIDNTDCGTELNHGVLAVGFARVDAFSTGTP
ncbi:hypothetical protein FOL47_010467 [Perkinsus chesapeaki]|uniref:Cysteine protease n=1 Tax=Perkinsus chesapeaki TaxID=330153 RepID=A0A7J6MPM4_PERCH|nr:hypothetical protein FOL47_010467 [Perkinsus chesapeaki]